MISKTSVINWLRKHQGTFLLLLVGLIVCGGCLKADFYMDDYMFIVKADYTAQPPTFIKLFGFTILGQETEDAMQTPLSLLLPRAVFKLTYDHFGPSPVVFHLWTLLSHLLLALLGRAALRKFLIVGNLAKTPDKAASIAFWAALIFLVHPLCSEPVHYAKCFYMQLVGISAILSCYATLSLVESMRIKYFVALIGALAFASISYPYGFPISIMQSFILFCFLSPRLGAWLGLIKTSRWMQALLVGCSIYAINLAKTMAVWYQSHLANMDYTYSSHILTQGRVFWEYISRMIIPTGLCSDHLVAWSTTWADAEAVVKLGFVFLLGMGCVILAWKQRRRPLGSLAVVILLIMTPLVVRWPYTSHETMVEYRTYPCMLWVALCFALAFTSLAHWMAKLPNARLRSVPRLTGILAGSLVFIFSCMNMQRGLVWRSFGTLAEDVVQSYPLSARGHSNLQYTTNLAGEFQETLAIHKELTQAMAEMKRLNDVDPLRRQYDIIEAEKAFLVSEGLCGAALANLEGPSIGIAYVEHRLQELRSSRPDLFEDVGVDKIPRIAPLLMNLHALRGIKHSIERSRSQKEDLLKSAKAAAEG
jgi:hypothetical protein